MEWIQMFGGGHIGAMILLTIITSGTDRARAFYFILNVTVAFSLSNTLRMCYGDARPSWLGAKPWEQTNPGSEIKNMLNYQCMVGYGNPDPHTVVSVSLATTLLLECTMGCRRVLKTVIAMPFALGYILVIAYARVLLGTLDYSQALYGVTLGVWIAFGQFHHRVNLLHRINKIIDAGTTGKSTLIASFVLWMVMLIIQIIVFVARPSMTNKKFK